MSGPNEQLTLDVHGLELVRRSEALRLRAYPDPGTQGAPWTIGYGHTGPQVQEGLVIELPQAEAWLRQDIARAEAAVRRQVLVPLTQGQFNALVDFTFNLGEASLARSTLLRLLNRGDYRAARGQFQRWVYGGGRVLPGLVTRRQREAELFDA